MTRTLGIIEPIAGRSARVRARRLEGGVLERAHEHLSTDRTIAYRLARLTNRPADPTLRSNDDVRSARPCTRAMRSKGVELLGGGAQEADGDRSRKGKKYFAVIPGTTHHDIIISSALGAIEIPFLGRCARLTALAQYGAFQ